MAGLSLAGAATALWLATAATAATLPATRPAITPANLVVIGMQPTEVVQWTPLSHTTSHGEPLAVVFAKATTNVGETVLDEVLAAKHSIGIYARRNGTSQWFPVWEVVTGEMGIAFVEGYDILDVNGDGGDDVCVRIRYYGEGRALDYKVLSLGSGQLRELFEQKSIYRGSVTAETGYIFVEHPLPEQNDVRVTTVYALGDDGRSFRKVREITDRETR
jgi:hypothetical protein